MIVLDTAPLLWWSLDPDKLSPQAEKRLAKISVDSPAIVSAISIWEIAIKVKHKKLILGVPVDKFTERLEGSGLVELVPVDHHLWLSSVALNWTHRDPADRVIVALAEEKGAKLVTSDRVIAGYYNDVVW